MPAGRRPRILAGVWAWPCSSSSSRCWLVAFSPVFVGPDGDRQGRAAAAERHADQERRRGPDSARRSSGSTPARSATRVAAHSGGRERDGHRVLSLDGVDHGRPSGSRSATSRVAGRLRTRRQDRAAVRRRRPTSPANCRTSTSRRAPTRGRASRRRHRSPAALPKDILGELDSISAGFVLGRVARPARRPGRAVGESRSQRREGAAADPAAQAAGQHLRHQRSGFRRRQLTATSRVSFGAPRPIRT